MMDQGLREWRPGTTGELTAQSGNLGYTAPMPGSGTDHTKEWTAIDGPVIVLVEPQLGENIGTAVRAMANFGLTPAAPRQAA